MATYGALSVTIDALVARYRLPPPNLVKLDVDGIEERILGGAGAVLASGALRTILVEVTCRASGEIPWAESKLAPHGYRLAGRSDWSVELHGLRSQNFIFTRRP
jgi:hypothetical protein